MTRLLFINLERVLNVISQIVEKKLLKKISKTAHNNCKNFVSGYFVKQVNTNGNQF